jgi:hypothetical protein
LLVAITAEDSFYIFRFNQDAYNAKVEKGAEITDEGVKEAFEVVAEALKSQRRKSKLIFIANNTKLTIKPSIKTAKGLLTASSIWLCNFVGFDPLHHQALRRVSSYSQ